MTVLFVVLALAAASPAPGATPLYSGSYTLRIPAGQTKQIGFPVPANLAASHRPITFTWRIVKPVPAPKFVFIEHCIDPDRCYPSVMRPTGEGSGTLLSRPRIINNSRLDLDVQIGFALWEAR